MNSKRIEALIQATGAQSRIHVETCSDRIEAQQRADECNRAALDLNKCGQMVAEIDLALERIDAGTFGVCLCCDQPIAAARLLAVPWTSFCIHCQEARESGLHGARMDALASTMLRNALAPPSSRPSLACAGSRAAAGPRLAPARLPRYAV